MTNNFVLFKIAFVVKLPDSQEICSGFFATSMKMKKEEAFSMFVCVCEQGFSFRLDIADMLGGGSWNLFFFCDDENELKCKRAERGLMGQKKVASVEKSF